MHSWCQALSQVLNMQRIANGGSSPQGAQSSRVTDSYANLGNPKWKSKGTKCTGNMEVAREDGNGIPFQPPQEATSQPWQ